MELAYYLRKNVKLISNGKEFVGYVNEFSEADDNYDNEDSIVLDIKGTRKLILFLASEIDSIEMI